MRLTFTLILAGLVFAGCGKSTNDTPGETAPPADTQPAEKKVAVVPEPEPGIRTPLHVAAYAGNAERVEELIREGADVNARGPKLWTPLHETTKQGALRAAEVLLANGADPNARDDRGWTVLHLCFDKWDYRIDDIASNNTRIAELLMAKGADVNAVAKDGDTPLHKAAEKRHDLAVAALLSAGAKVDARGRNGDTPLHRAVKGSPESVKRLLGAGADVNATNELGQAPIHGAASHRLYEDTLKLFIARGADVKVADEEGTTPLHMVAAACDVESAKLLLSKGADVNAQRVDGRTPRSFACKSHRTEMIKFLTENGAKKNLGRPTVEQVLKTNHRYGKPAFRLRGKAAGIWFAIDPTLSFVAGFSGVDILGFLIDEGIDEVIVWTRGGDEGFTVAVPFTQGHAIEFDISPGRGGKAHLMHKAAVEIAKHGTESSSARELLKMLFGPPPGMGEEKYDAEIDQMLERLTQKFRRVAQAPSPTAERPNGS